MKQKIKRSQKLQLSTNKPRGDKRSATDQVQMRTDILSLLPNKGDMEIMQILKIPETTFYRYKNIIYEEAKEIWQQTARVALEYQALQVISSAKEYIKVNTAIANDTTVEPKERRESSKAVVDANIMIFNVLEYGPKLNNKAMLPE